MRKVFLGNKYALVNSGADGWHCLTAADLETNFTKVSDGLCNVLVTTSTKSKGFVGSSQAPTNGQTAFGSIYESFCKYTHVCVRA